MSGLPIGGLLSRIAASAVLAWEEHMWVQQWPFNFGLSCSAPCWHQAVVARRYIDDVVIISKTALFQLFGWHDACHVHCQIWCSPTIPQVALAWCCSWPWLPCTWYQTKLVRFPTPMGCSAKQYSCVFVGPTGPAQANRFKNQGERAWPWPFFGSPC